MPDSRIFAALLDTTPEEMSELHLLRVLKYNKQLDRGQ